MQDPVLFILGADDPEMQRIEAILSEQGYRFQYATKDGRRVHPGNAYEADAIDSIGEAWHIVLVECNPATLPIYNGEDVIVVDHHRPGDPGYGMEAKDFWKAPSIGQVARQFLKSSEGLTHDDLVLAAMDHCPANAIRGECPGVTAQEVLDRKVQEIAAATGHPTEDVYAGISWASSIIESAPEISISMDGGMLRDVRETDLGEGYSFNLLTMQTAALAGGYGVLLLSHDRGETRDKWTVAGHVSSKVIEAFMKYWAPSKGLEGIYGVPNRGYAGGYLP